MNFIKKVRAFYVLILLLLSTQAIAQVTIGLKEAPISGALLQLKNLDSSVNNADKGLLLPRVELTHIGNLYPMFPTDYNKIKEDPIHTGLVVYNVNEDLFNGDGAGFYVWDGEKWMGVGMTKRKISINPIHIYISEIKPSATAQLSIAPKNLKYSLSSSGSNSSKLSLDSITGKTTLSINPDVGGDRRYTFTLKNSTLSASVDVHHLKLTMTKDLVKVGENDTISTSAIIAEGASASWVVKDYTKNVFNWTIPPQYKDGKLYFALGAAKSTGNIEGSITFAHADDLNYTKEFKVTQNKEFIVLPEFDYLVVKYLYKLVASDGSVDLDTATEINGTQISSIDRKSVGYAVASGSDPMWESYMVRYKDLTTSAIDTILTSAGDNITSGYESVYSNMTKLRELISDTAPRVFNVDMYGSWYTPEDKGTTPNNKIAISISLYKGGTMHKDGYNYYNLKDGVRTTPVKVIERDNIVVDKGGRGSDRPKIWRDTYTPLLRLEYDRVDETGLVMRFADIPTTRTNNLKMRSNSEEEDYATFYEKHADEIHAIEKLPNETKEQHAKRIDEYVRKLRKEKKKEHK